ncbi:uncharacterized protein LOC135937286 isoform X2 [Cloeon dipterum]|uniref:uncharacterized protein LOC135937286 isoform X2 n=1 Tax=Cloeon dipterum TaxID=197152 RepID=UPI003220008F
MSKATGTVPKAKKRPNPSAQFNNDEQPPSLWPPVNNLQSTDWHAARQSNSQRDPPPAAEFTEQFAAFLASEGASGSRGTRQSIQHMTTTGSQSFPRGREHQSPTDMDGDTRTNGIDHQQRYPEGGAHALLDATKNNIARIPDRNQVLSRLNQIRDYVKQTSALMDSLNGSTDSSHLAQTVRLSRMQSELQESERKLVQMLAVIPPNDEGTTNGNASPLGFSSGAIPKARDQNQLVVNQQQSRRRVSSSEERSPGPGPTPAQYAKHQELKLKVEESQKKLQALVQHQAALISLQEKAQQQLRDPKSLSQEFLRNWTDRADSLTGQFQDMSTTDAVSLLGDHDKELDAEFMAIQERLQEIHDRKRTVDRLNRDMQTLQLSPRENHLSTSSDEEEVEQVTASFVDVDAKVEELNNMKARLANLQSLVAAINRGEMPYDSIKTALASQESEPRRDHSSRSSSSKPDNTFRNSDTLPKSIDDQTLEIRHKAQQLDKAKQKLQQLKEILSAAGLAEDDLDEEESVNSYSSTGRNADQQIPNQELEQLMRTYLQQPKAETTPSPSVPQRKNKNIKQDLVNIVHDPTGSSQKAYMQAKRQELEEMMRKDQGQSSSLNQDTCNASGITVSDTGATWGGSMLSSVQPQSEQQQSINCSSDEFFWETDLMGANGPTTHPLYSLAATTMRQVQNSQKSPAANKNPIWPEPPLESSTPIYDVPPRSGSSTATPRPMGDEASPHAQWWLLQQQLEASNATCQNMMQQWQWGSPSPESWWMSSPIASQMMTTLSQCCQMLWMQQREIMNLHATLQSMQDRMVCNEQNLSANFQPPPFNNSAEVNASASVTGAHSLPNLCEGLPQFMIPPSAHFPWPPTQTPNNASALPTLIRHGPQVTLNNQVPPGVRANNYWDNFRSYSRQNLLSTNTKVNDGQIQHPSPLTDRSHNSLRNNGESQPLPSRSSGQQPRKQKLNSERPPVPSQQAPLIQSHSFGNLPAEQLFSELASLVAQNQSHPEFLPQLFRELKTLRCTSDCQRVLNSIREIGRQDELLRSEEASNNRSETPEGAAALPFKSPQRQVNENQVDTKIQSLLLQLMPFLKSKRDDCCTPLLLDFIIQRTLSHVTITQQPALNSFVHGQLQGRLADALAKFQGCWLRDVGEEMLATVAEVLLKELAFFKLFENVVDQGGSATLFANAQNDAQTINSDALLQDEQVESSDSEMGEAAAPPTPPQRNCWLPPSLREATKVAMEAKTETVEVDLCDGDLAEADQSHEVAVQEPDGRGSQAEGTDTPDMGRQLDSLETINLSVEQPPTANDEVWQVEQDRELDQVPSRLEPGETSQLPGPPSGQP